MLTRIILGLIRVYQKLSARLWAKSCRYYPTCSQYTLEAIQKYGLGSGIWKGLKRIARCHPYHPGGVDLP